MRAFFLSVILTIIKMGMAEMKLFIKLLLFAFFMLSVTVHVSGGKVFWDSIKLNCKVIVPLNPTKVEQFAASELKKFIEATYSKPVPLNGQNGPVTFFIGFSSDAVKRGFSGIEISPGKFGISRIKSDFLFWGYDYKDLDPVKTSYYEAGTLSSVYYFLNKYIGVKFFLPGEDGYSLSFDKPVRFEIGNDIPVPTFEVRGFSTETREYSIEQMNIFSRRMLCNLPFWSKRDLYYVFLDKWKKRFWNTDPEYFMIRNGARVNEKYPLHVPCFTNPDVVRQVAADIVAEINLKPEIKVVRIFCDAPIKQCQCVRCQSAPERKFCGKDINVGEEVYGFQKKIIDLVRQAYPGTYFISQTKGAYYNQPPKLVKMSPRFTMYILTDYPFPAANYSNNIQQIKNWNATGVKTILKSYPRYPAFCDYPIINTRVLHNYLNKFKGITSGAVNSDLKYNVPYIFCAFGQYAQGRMLFDINLKRDDLLYEFCEFAYPGAEAEMITFYNEMENLFSQCTSLWESPLKSFYMPHNLHKAMSCLDRAAIKVKKKNLFVPLYDNFKKFYTHSVKANTNVDPAKDGSSKKQ